MKPQTPLHPHSFRVVNPEAPRTPQEEVKIGRLNVISSALLFMGASMRRSERVLPLVDTSSMFGNSAPIGKTPNPTPEIAIARPVSKEPTLEIDPIHEKINMYAQTMAEASRAFEEINR